MTPHPAPRHHRTTSPAPRPGRARRPRAALAGWTALLALALVGLLRAGDALPAPPDLGRPGDALRWLDVHGAPVAAFAVLRATGMVVASYLLAATLLGVLARASRRPGLVRLADAVTVHRLRAFLRATAAVGALSVPVLATTPSPAWAATEPAGGPPPTIRVLTTEAPAPAPTPSTAPGRLPGIDPPVLRRLPTPLPTAPTAGPPDVPGTTAPPTVVPTAPAPDRPEPSTSIPTPDPTPGPTPSEPSAGSDRSDARPPSTPTPSAAPGPAPDAPASAGPDHLGDTGGAAQPPGMVEASHPADLSGRAPEGTWRIEPGDHLWRVAEQTLRTRTGRTPTDDETATYLTRLIAANHDVLVVADNPDLVFAGQVFVLPAVTP